MTKEKENINLIEQLALEELSDALDRAIELFGIDRLAASLINESYID